MSGAIQVRIEGMAVSADESRLRQSASEEDSIGISPRYGFQHNPRPLWRFSFIDGPTQGRFYSTSGGARFPHASVLPVLRQGPLRRPPLRRHERRRSGIPSPLQPFHQRVQEDASPFQFPQHQGGFRPGVRFIDSGLQDRAIPFHVLPHEGPEFHPQDRGLHSQDQLLEEASGRGQAAVLRRARLPGHPRQWRPLLARRGGRFAPLRDPPIRSGIGEVQHRAAAAR